MMGGASKTDAPNIELWGKCMLKTQHIAKISYALTNWRSHQLSERYKRFDHRGEGTILCYAMSIVYTTPIISGVNSINDWSLSEKKIE